MQKILITGGAGFIASSLAEALIRTNRYFVVVLDNLLTGNQANVLSHENYRFIKGDANKFNDLSSVMTHYGFDYVFHYAAVVGVKRTLDNPYWVLEDIRGFQNIFDLSKNTGVKRIFFSSSSEVYGEPVHLPQHEDETPLNSRLPYAVVKNVGESFCRSYHKEFGLDYTILRFFNTYGPRQSSDFVISKFLNAALSGNPLTVYGDGEQTRTFCYIDDNIDFTIRLLESGLLINEVVNVGNDQLISIRELAQVIIRLTNSNSAIVYMPPLPEGDMTRRQPDNRKMLQVLGRRLIDLEEGLQRIISKI